MIECCVVENASTMGDICDKVVRIGRGASGARGLVSGANSGKTHLTEKMSSDPKNKA